MTTPWHSADITDGEGLAAILRAERPRAVFHLAGQSSAAQSFRDPEATYRANVLGTWTLLDAVIDRCVKIEHARLFGGLHWAGVNTQVISAKKLL